MISPATAATAFEQHYGRPPLACAFAPGRVNLIGEHIDYAGGCCIPMAIQLGVTMAIAPGSARVSRLYSPDLPQDETGVVARDSAHKHLRLAYHILQNIGLHQAFDIMVQCDLPIGMGLSSSAAFELALAGALLACAEQSPRISPRTLAIACQRAERAAHGTQCGLLDQFASLYGREGQALLLDCRSLEHSYLPFPAHKLRVLLIDSLQPRELAASGYNERRRELEQAFSAVGLYGADFSAQHSGQAGQVNRGLSLWDGSAEEAEPQPELTHWRELPAHELLRLSTLLDEPLNNRLMHVTTEQTRVESFARDLAAGDIPMLTLNLTLSHASLRLLYEVSTVGIDALCSALGQFKSSRGARIHGGGFGGCVLALFAAEADLSVLEQLVEHAILPELRVLEVQPSAGAQIWQPGRDLNLPGASLLDSLPAADEAVSGASDGSGPEILEVGRE